MTHPELELITIKKQDLLEFIKSVGFKVEEYQNQNLTHGFEISGYQDAGDVFLIDCASHSNAPGADKVLDDVADIINARITYLRELKPEPYIRHKERGNFNELQATECEYIVLRIREKQVELRQQERQDFNPTIGSEQL